MKGALEKNRYPLRTKHSPRVKIYFVHFNFSVYMLYSRMNIQKGKDNKTSILAPFCDSDFSKMP